MSVLIENYARKSILLEKEKIKTVLCFCYCSDYIILGPYYLVFYMKAVLWNIEGVIIRELAFLSA